MSLNTLLESANPYQSLQSDAARLASKWEKTGLLEGMNGAHKNNMGLILENQAKQLVVESSQTSGGVRNRWTFQSQTGVNVGGQWAGVALPLVRKVFGQIAAQEFVSVQPMNLPSGLVFFLDFQYGSSKTPFAAGSSLYGDTSVKTPFGNTTQVVFMDQVVLDILSKLLNHNVAFNYAFNLGMILTLFCSIIFTVMTYNTANTYAFKDVKYLISVVSVSLICSIYRILMVK